MKANQTIISLKQIRKFYKEECEKEELEDDGKKYSEKEFEKFVEFCEIDLYDWLRGNLRYFQTKQFNES